MVDFDLDDWDDEFINQVFHAEEHALSSVVTQAPPINFSPPRELSQRARVHETNLKDDEINRLKEEIARVSNQLAHLDQECAELRKKRDRKDEELQSVYSKSTVNNAQLDGRDSNLSKPQTCTEYHASLSIARDGSISGIPARKAVGVQTDNDEPNNSNVKSSHFVGRVSSKLLSVWYPSDIQVARDMVSKMMVSCEADIRDLLASVDPNLQHLEYYSALVEPLIASLDPAKAADAADTAKATDAAKAAKILHFHYTLTRFSEGLVKVGDLLEALVALCRLKNVSIISRSLHILHILLNFSVSLRRNSERRDDVIETSSSENDVLKFSSAERTVHANGKGKEITNQSCNLNFESFATEVSNRKHNFDHSSLVSFDQINWVSLLQLMREISSIYTGEYVRQEAVSIMNIILMRNNPYTEREKFVSEELFQSISDLLRKEAGLGVQTQALHLLYLLLNCPKTMSWFCTTCREEMERAGKISDIDANSISASQGCHTIFEGLADCISCSGLGSQELRLRRNAIILLAFLASSGTCGVEIMFGTSTAKKFHLLAIILLGLTSDIDLEAKESVQSPEIFKERILLMRETLILLNGLVSHPQYCGPVLRALTSPRDMICLTLGIANKLTTKTNCRWKDDSITAQIRQVEVLELARVFRKRIFTFLGNSIP